MNASLDVYATSIGSQGKGNILGFIAFHAHRK